MEYSFLEKIIIENSLAGFFITSLNGELLDCNQSFIEIFGYSAKEEVLNVKTISFYNDSKDRNIYIQRLLKDGVVKNLDILGKKKDGKTFYFRINSNLYTDEHHNRFIVGSIIDVTLELQAELKIKEEQNKISTFINNSVQIIQSFDKTGKIMFVNNAWKDAFGYDDNDLKSIYLFDIISNEYKNHCSAIFKDVLQGIPAFDIEAEFISKSGEKILLKGNILPLMKDGELIATHAFFNDIGKLEKVNKKLKEQEAILQTILDNTPVCLYLKDENGKYIFSNKIMQDTLACEVTGKTDQEIFGKDSSELLKITDKNSMSEEEKLTVFNFTSNKSGIEKHFYCGKKAVSRADNSKVIFGYSVDITELSNKTLKIEENEKILNLIVSNSSIGIMLFSLDNSKNKYYLDYSNDFCRNLIEFEENKHELSDILSFIDLDTINYLHKFNEDSLVYEWNKVINDQVKFYRIVFSKIKITESVCKLLVLFNDVTEKNLLIKDLEFNLSENKILLGEVHHRVKNNLAIIDGIIEMNKFKMSNSIYEEHLSDIQLRIKSIGLVHEKLYKSSSLSTIVLLDYISELCHQYRRMYETNSRNKINFNIKVQENCTMDINRSISIGLLLSELISNSVKYAMKDHFVCINIKLEEENNHFIFVYSDSGNGIDGDFSLNNSKGFGFKLIKSLMNQLKAEHQIFTKGGFNFTLKFNN